MPTSAGADSKAGGITVQAHITCISRKKLSIESLMYVKYLTSIFLILTAILEGSDHYHSFTGEETRVVTCPESYS